MKTSGILRDPRLLSVTFGDWRCDGEKMKKTSNTAKILGLQGDKVVSAEGIESALERNFNSLQGPRMTC